MTTPFRLLRTTPDDYLANPQFDVSLAAPADSALVAGSLATDMWFFHHGRVSLTGMKAAGVIAPNIQAPTYDYAGLTTPASGNHNGLITNINELASETWIIVFLMPLTADATRDILGNLTATSSDGGWGIFHQSATGLRLSTRATINSLVTLTLPSNLSGGGKVCALAIAHQATSTKYRFRNNSSTTTSLTAVLSSPVRKICLGEVFNSNGRSLAVTIYAVAAYSSYLSDANIDAEIANYIVPYCNGHGVGVES